MSETRKYLLFGFYRNIHGGFGCRFIGEYADDIKDDDRMKRNDDQCNGALLLGEKHLSTITLWPDDSPSDALIAKLFTENSDLNKGTLALFAMCFEMGYDECSECVRAERRRGAEF